MEWVILILIGVPSFIFVCRFWGRLLRRGVVWALDQAIAWQQRAEKTPIQPTRKEPW